MRRQKGMTSPNLAEFPAAGFIWELCDSISRLPRMQGLPAANSRLKPKPGHEIGLRMATLPPRVRSETAKTRLQDGDQSADQPWKPAFSIDRSGHPQA